MELDQGMEERSVWNFGNYLRTALFLLFACAILSHDRTDLALLEGGIGGPAIYHNWIGFLGAHTARVMFYTFGLATYPFLLIVFLLLLRRFIPGLPRRGTLWWALPAILLGTSMLFAMCPQQFIAETDHLGIGRMEQSSLALSGGVVGAALAAPQSSAALDAGLVRRYIGDVGTILVALAFLLPALVFLFIRDWLPLLKVAFRADPKQPEPEAADEPEVQPVPAGRPGKIYTPGNPEGEVWTPPASAPEIHQYGEEEAEEDGEPEEEAEEKPSGFKTALGKFLGLRTAPPAKPDGPEDENEDDDIVAPPVRPPAQTMQRPSAVIRDPNEVVAPPQKRRNVQPAPGAVIRDPDELVVTPRPRPAAPAPAPAPAPVPQPAPAPVTAPQPQEEIYDEPEEPAAAYPEAEPEADIEEEPVIPAPAPQPAPRVIPVQTFAENKKKFDHASPPPAPADEPPPPPPVYEEYHLPSPMLLDRHGDAIAEEDQAYIREASLSLEKTLESFGVNGYVSNITVGPRVTQFEIALNPGVRVEKVTSIQNNIAMAMEAQSIRIRAPIPGKDAVGIEVPNKASSTVYLRPLLESATWRESRAAIPILLGRDIAGSVYLTDLSKAPHLLIAGSTGSGKSVCMNTLIMSLLFRFSPDELKLIMVDPKVVELEMYRPIPHLITPVVNDPKKVPLALRWGVNEMERRYMVLAKVKAKNLAAFNSRPPDPQPVIDDYGEVVPPKLPILIIIIDELADIMMTDAKSDVETSICRIAQKGRAAGVHLVIATQSPRKEVVTGLIKANIPTKIAFRVSNGMDSRVILDAVGAEKLLGNGDMLFNPPGAANLERIQGAYVSDSEIAKVIDEVAAQRPQLFDDGIFAGGDEEEEEEDAKGRRGKGKASRGGSRDGGDYDDELDDYDEIDGMANSDIVKAAADKYLQPTDPPIMVRALEIIINEQQVSTSYLQRRLGIGYNKAADIIDKLEQRHVISAPLPGGQKRTILITDGLETPND
jgi:S-DNA-T family DNA segregation ATPase FtsK/SpoIIIE